MVVAADPIMIQGKPVEVESQARGGSPRAGIFLERLTDRVVSKLKGKISESYVRNVVARNKLDLLELVDELLFRWDQKKGAGADKDLPPDEWTAKKRTEANIAAMDLVASKCSGSGCKLTEAERGIVSKYSGWGGLSIKAVEESGRFPAGFPKPEIKGLIHEYYTPTNVSAEIARVCQEKIANLPTHSGQILALEPAAGIGRLVRAFTGKGTRSLNWSVVEWSQVSATLLGAMRPELTLYNMAFEQWVTENGAEVDGKLGLVLANPPYGARGAAVTEDPNRFYREDKAYAYFMRRGLDLLARWGLGVYLVPYGFMSGEAQTNHNLREKVLLRHHIAAAYRLPSSLFPGALIVVDLIFFRSRGGELKSVPADDQFILDGKYFEHYPKHILGTEVGKQSTGWEKRWEKRLDVTKAKPRWGYQVEGKFTKLPTVIERPLLYDLPSRNYVSVDPDLQTSGVARVIKKSKFKDSAMKSAYALGKRVDGYLILISQKKSKPASQLHADLKHSLVGWAKLNGNPHKNKDIAKALADDVTYIQRFVAAYTKAGKLISGLQKTPKYEVLFKGATSDIIGQADFLYRQMAKASKRMTIADVMKFNRKVGGNARKKSTLKKLFAADWAQSGNDWNELVPPDIYYTGWLTPRYEAAKKVKGTYDQVAKQYVKLREKIGLVEFDDINVIDPRQGWIPLILVEKWVNTDPHLQGDIRRKFRSDWDTIPGSPVKLIFQEGVYQFQGIKYEELQGSGKGIANDWGIERETVNLIGYMNYDMRLFRPPASKKEESLSLEKQRLRMAKEWAARFAEFIGSDDKRRRQIEESYVGHFKGWVEPSYSAEQLDLARWGDLITPHGYQVQGARRLLQNRGGLLAYDVGVGKTFTAILTIAQGRQEGFIRRPLILVPNTLVWKWQTDIRKCCPDFRCVVIGAKKYLKQPTAKDFGGVKLNKEQKLLLKALAFGGIKALPADTRAITKFRKLGIITKDGDLKAFAEFDENKLTQAQRDMLAEMVIEDATLVNSRVIEALRGFGFVSGNELSEKGSTVAMKLKGHVASKTDTPQERAQKWTEYQAGMYDVAIITYSAFPRTKIDLKILEEYVNRNDAIKREVELQYRNATALKSPPKGKEKSERHAAILSEKEQAWLALKTELPENQKYDPGIDFSALGIDWLVVDEAQNFKNLYMPASREGGIPKYMGTGVASKRAWQLDFRTYLVRRNTGGGGIVLLSATPAKNSPLELYNVLQFVDHTIWQKRGILNGEQFVSRYLKIKMDLVYDAVNAEFTLKNAVMGFWNVNELRDALYRYAQFLSAKDAGLTLPEAKVGDPVIVSLNDEQESKYVDYLNTADEVRKDFTRRGEFLALLAKMSLVALHQDLDEKYTWDTATAVDPHSAKIDEIARRVRRNRNCGHIIFCEPLAAQRWMYEVLQESDSGKKPRQHRVSNPKSRKARWYLDREQRGRGGRETITNVLPGIPVERIAVLNAKTAKGASARQEIARKFNGGLDDDDMPDENIEPLYDVVIANQVAYEGIDLQRRTCEIHHLDLPWEPSTLQQRNGRGLRQGNILGAIAINVYLSAQTNDIVRFDSIRGKHGWMTALLESNQNEISNPAAALEMSPEDMAAQCSRNPERARRLVTASREAAKKKIQHQKSLEASRQAKGVASIYKKVREETDSIEAEVLRRQAEIRLKQLESYVDAEVWPHLSVFERVVKTEDVWIIDAGPPVYSGMRATYYVLTKDETGLIETRSLPNTIECGRLVQITRSSTTTDPVSGKESQSVKKVRQVYVRQMDRTEWYPMDFAVLAGMEWESVPPVWDESVTAVKERIAKTLSHFRNDPWDALKWKYANEEWRKQWWEQFRSTLLNIWEGSGYNNDQWIPLTIKGDGFKIGQFNKMYNYQINAYGKALKLLLQQGPELIKAIELSKPQAVGTRIETIPTTDLSYGIIPPTEEGYADFIQAAIKSNYKMLQINACTEYWWGRLPPSGYIYQERAEIQRYEEVGQAEEASRDMLEKSLKRNADIDPKAKPYSDMDLDELRDILIMWIEDETKRTQIGGRLSPLAFLPKRKAKVSK